MFKLTVVLALLSVSLGAPQTRSVPTLDGRIVGGEDADIADYSYQLSLLFLGSHICGAATIAPTWALTAAHCTQGIPLASLLTVRAGSSIRNSGGQVVTILQMTSHANYTRPTLDYDITVLLLSSAIDTSYSQAIPLPPAGVGPTTGSTLVVTGWGATSELGNSSTNLQVVEVPVISQDSCTAAYINSNVTNRMFCAGLLETGGKDACQGDSGGPAVVNNVLYGLVSWGDGCARAGSPGVYTNIAALRTWIASVTGL